MLCLRTFVPELASSARKPEDMCLTYYEMCFEFQIVLKKENFCMLPLMKPVKHESIGE